MKDIIKKPGFWAAVSALIVIIAQTLGLKAESETINQIITGVCSVLIIAGVLSSADFKKIADGLKKDDGDKDADEDNTEEKNG